MENFPQPHCSVASTAQVFKASAQAFSPTLRGLPCPGATRGSVTLSLGPNGPISGDKLEWQRESEAQNTQLECKPDTQSKDGRRGDASSAHLAPTFIAPHSCFRFLLQKCARVHRRLIASSQLGSLEAKSGRNEAKNKNSFSPALPSASPPPPPACPTVRCFYINTKRTRGYHTWIRPFGEVFV